MSQAPANRALSSRERAALALLFLIGIVVPLFALPGAASGPPQPVAIVFGPWVSASDAIARSLSAGYPVLRSGRSAFIVVAAPVEPASSMRPEGAIMVLTLSGLAGCLDAVATEAVSS